MTSRDLNMLLWCKAVHSGVWVGGRDICHLKNSLIRGFFFSSAFFSCALNAHVIGLLFLRQCFAVLSPSTETSISGMSWVLPLWMEVSALEQHMYVVLPRWYSCEISWWYFMPCMAVLSFPLWSPFGPCPKYGCVQIVGGLGLGGGEMMQRHAWECEFGRKGVKCGCVGGGRLIGNMLRRGGSSWLCIKFELAFIAGHGTLPVSEVACEWSLHPFLA